MPESLPQHTYLCCVDDCVPRKDGSLNAWAAATSPTKAAMVLIACCVCVVDG